MNSALTKCLSISAVVHLRQLLVICAGAVIPYSCEKQSVCQGTYFPPFLEMKKRKDDSPGQLPCAGVCKPSPAAVFAECAACSCALKTDAARISLESTSPDFLPKQKLQSTKLFTLCSFFFTIFFFFWKIDYEWLQILCDKITQISSLLVWRT